jgi:hypothetical protein
MLYQVTAYNGGVNWERDYRQEVVAYQQVSCLVGLMKTIKTSHSSQFLAVRYRTELCQLFAPLVKYQLFKLKLTNQSKTRAGKHAAL